MEVKFRDGDYLGFLFCFVMWKTMSLGYHNILRLLSGVGEKTGVFAGAFGTRIIIFHLRRLRTVVLSMITPL